MYLTMDLETLMQALAILPRERCVAELADVPHLHLDFTDDYLATQSTDQLRHLLLAALLQARRRSRAPHAAARPQSAA